MISLILLSVILTFILYRKSPLFIPLRILTIVLLALLIFNVTVPFKLRKTYTPPLILRDHSASMAAYVPTITAALETIEYPHVTAYFSESLYTTAPDDTAALGSFTNITGAINKACAYEPSAVIVISDGNHNVNTEPVSQMRALNIPVYCFGVGAETQRDAALVDVIYPEYAYAGDSIHVQTMVQSAGFEGGTATVELQTERGAMLQRKTFPLSNIQARNTIEFIIPINDLGEQSYKVVIKPLSTEHNYSNNESSFSIHALEEKLTVLYYTGHISFTTKFIMRVLRANNRFALTPVVQLAKGALQNVETRELVTLPPLTSFDAVILDNVLARRISWSDIEEFLSNGGGILCIGTLEEQTAQSREILPIAASVPIAGRHQLTITEPFSILTPYDEYPPLPSVNRVSNVKQDAVIIAHTENIPVIAYRTYMRGIVFQINTTDIGTWHFLTEGTKKEDVLSDLISDIVRFISPSGHGRRLVLTSVRREYNVGDIVDMTLQSFDRDYRHAGGGDFFMEYDTSRVPFFEVRKGVYKATFIIDKPGVQRLIASGKLHSEALESNELNLTVHSRRIESDQGLNQEFLETIARVTGGTYAPLDAFPAFRPPQPQEQYTMRAFHLDRPLTYIVIVLVLALEWFIRRKRGTL